MFLLINHDIVREIEPLNMTERDSCFFFHFSPDRLIERFIPFEMTAGERPCFSTMCAMSQPEQYSPISD